MMTHNDGYGYGYGEDYFYLSTLWYTCTEHRVNNLGAVHIVLGHALSIGDDVYINSKQPEQHLYKKILGCDN